MGETVDAGSFAGGTSVDNEHMHVPHPTAAHIREATHTGDSADTPFIALSEIVLFLLPVVAILMGACFLAYYLAR